MLRDHTGKELNLDGTPKTPYRHPNYGNTRLEGAQSQGHIAQQQTMYGEYVEEEVGEGNFRRQRPTTPVEHRRAVLIVKPAK